MNKRKIGAEKKLIDMTKGSVLPLLIRFAVPLAAGSVFQLLYGTTDLLFVGNFVGTSAAAAVGASSLLVTCMIGIFSGIAAGTSVAVSQAVGAQKEKEAASLIHTAVGFALTAGFLLMIAGELSAPYLLRLMKTPEEIMPDAVAYIRLYFIGMIPLILYNIGSGVLRAWGDSKSPFYILAFGGFLNVAVDALLIAGWNLGVCGAAIATSISQTFSAIAVVLLLRRGNEKMRFRIQAIRVQHSYLMKILRFGLPAGIQSMLITLSNLIVQYFINGFGSDTIAAYTAYFKLENFTYLPVLAFGQAAMTFTAQNMGAGKIDRIKKGVWVSGIISVLSVSCISFGLLAIGPTALGWFGKDREVISLGMIILAVSFPFYWLNSLIEVFGGAIRGMGYAFLSMVIVLCAICGGRILLLNVFVTRFHNIKVLTSVYPLTWSAAAVLLFLAMIWSLKKVGRVMENEVEIRGKL